MVDITKATSTHNTTATSGRSIKYIAIHYTAGTTSRAGSAKNTANYFKTTSTKASADYIVDDSSIVQYNPDPSKYICWHVGGSNYGTKGGSLYGVAKNANCIGIEICSSSETGKVVPGNNANWYFTAAAVNNAVDLAKYLMQKYNIPADRVIRHYDVTGKLCPGIIGWNKDSGSESEWQAFKARLSGATASGGTSGTSIAAGVYKVTASALNVRSGPGTGYSKLGKLSKGTQVTVTGSSGAWAAISYNGAKAYVSGEYLAWVSAIPAAPATPATPAGTPSSTKNDNVEDEENMTLETFSGLMKQYRATLNDNDASEWSAAAREWAVSNGLISGTDAGKFNGAWEDFLTREQMAQLLYNFAKWIGKA